MKKKARFASEGEGSLGGGRGVAARGGSSASSSATPWNRVKGSAMTPASKFSRK